MSTFLIADTFTDSLARLTGDEQKAVKTTAFDLQMDASAPGLSFHRLDKARDKRFWSVRVSADIRLIVHRTDRSLLLCYVDHHDRAYAWAERRKLETHPSTGAAQIIELRESVREIVVPAYVPAVTSPKPAARPLAGTSDRQLLEFGVPSEWLDDVRQADEDGLLALAQHLPAEAAEAILELATGGAPRPLKPEAPPSGVPADPFTHPDAQRRFRVVTSVAELEQALDAPWDKWAVFLHPEQRQLVTRDYTGPARVSGSAGTGKTVVAIHRAVHMARSRPDARILLATFSDPLAHALRANVKRLIGAEPRVAERLEVFAMRALGLRLHQAQLGPVRLASSADIETLLQEAASTTEGHRFSASFLRDEWEHVVDAWQLESWEDYRDVQRLGRRTRLPESGRTILWKVFERVRAGLKSRGLLTESAMFQGLADAQVGRITPAYDASVIDEAQDVSIAQLRFLAALGAGRPNGLFFSGDTGQRIFQQPFSWKALGVDIRGRSKSLRVNYRTSHQIREQADRLLGSEIADVDGNREDRRHTLSVFNGPPPDIRTFATETLERAGVGEWLRSLVDGGLKPHELAVFVRSSEQSARATAAVTAAGLSPRLLDDRVDVRQGETSVATMHLAKGLEFRAVAVMACDDEVVPLQSRIESVGDDGDLQEVYDTERHLLYVACTRARDRLFISGVEPTSEFLGDLRPTGAI
ncbi:3'-5' exonuclease [Luteitalea sp.]|uniref:3'-5' exonuclease n=1 Tax=Luteitalea sp. TaxID=2004800 RepID=UPI0025C468A3|nr:3'-5' exonuclease [Luteitalea sp.]